MKYGLIARGNNRCNRLPHVIVKGTTLGRKCTAPGCDKKRVAHGLCGMHLQRMKTRGTLDKWHWARDPEERFRALVDIGPDEGSLGSCWLWKGSVTKKGYAMFSPGPGGPKTQSAHRWAYVHFIGEVPAGRELDHLCRVRHCVNPDHLEAVTSKVNQERSPFNPAVRTHCPRGHPYSEENTYRNPRGGRVCRICRRASQVAFKARKGKAH